MKLLKHFYVTALITISLVSCKSIHKIPVPIAVQNGVEIGAKNMALTESEKQTWGHADIATDTIPGMSILQAYDFLKGKKSIEVIVAVNDSGIDLDHEDLKDVLWTNPKEIAGNGIDNDKNGYIDDIHGWNFLGDIYDENLEITRIIKLKSEKFEGKIDSEIDPKHKEEYDEYMKMKEVFDEKLDEASSEKEKYTFYLQMFETSHDAMIANTGKEDYDLADVEAIVTVDAMLLKQKEFTLNILNGGTSISDEIKQIQRGLDHYTSSVDNHYNLDFNPRKDLLGDDENDMSTKYYGNGDPSNRQIDEIHGTHVAGIILASNGNGKGVDGVAINAKLMSVRCVPNGDEYDKDVALAFRYAVDNGAKVINTSFGKTYSMHADWVHEAIKYAEKHDVLIVNAAGNDAEDIDVVATYPNDAPDLKEEISDNMITIGAIGSSYDKNMLAVFSNFGQINVDIFAPGVKIYAPVPNNEYKYLSGTSMASPSTAGVAAMIRSYYPELSASQVKHILMNSGTIINFKVIKPGTEDELVSLSELCVSGRIVNAFNAVKMADEMVVKKK
ncbi:S8 family peptidase [Flavicella sp.]|uniref:S8 family peptidase n=1 Tax=Flavicella sp. TaxID=2957742 RepID=UPI0030194F55